jgi:hypothetical protein
MRRQVTVNSFWAKAGDYWESNPMCLITDVMFLSSSTDDDKKPVFDWLMSDKISGRLVVGGRLKSELSKFQKGGSLMRLLDRRGRLRKIEDEKVNIETQRLQKNNLCKSTDHHIIALARISGARLLCSKDKNLQIDFKNKHLINNPRGHVYKTAEHADLILKYGHTRACGIK